MTDIQTQMWKAASQSFSTNWTSSLAGGKNQSISFTRSLAGLNPNASVSPINATSAQHPEYEPHNQRKVTSGGSATECDGPGPKGNMAAAGRGRGQGGCSGAGKGERAYCDPCSAGVRAPQEPMLGK